MSKPVTLMGMKSAGHVSGSHIWLPTSIIEGTSKILINGKPVATVGKKLQPHECIIPINQSHPDSGNPPHVHQETCMEGSPKVLFENQPVCRMGDALTYDEKIAEGFGKVLIGG